jgi:hypothetical protein
MQSIYAMGEVSGDGAHGEIAMDGMERKGRRDIPNNQFARKGKASPSTDFVRKLTMTCLEDVIVEIRPTQVRLKGNQVIEHVHGKGHRQFRRPQSE